MELKDLKWPEVAALGNDVPIVIPVAALEQHGHHLPVFTDSMLLGEIVRRVTPRFETTVLFAPLMWLGSSDHHLEFAGTLSAPPRTYLDLLCGLIENYLTHGFKRLVILNGHGGNDVPARQAVFETRQRHRARSDLLLLAATYWNLGGRPYETDSTIFQKQMGHACEWETSMILRIAPQLVGDYASTEPVGFDDAFEGVPRGWITKDRTNAGHIGYPHLASAEKGEVLLNAFAQDVAGLIERVVKWDGQSWG